MPQSLNIERFHSLLKLSGAYLATVSAREDLGDDERFARALFLLHQVHSLIFDAELLVGGRCEVSLPSNVQRLGRCMAGCPENPGEPMSMNTFLAQLNEYSPPTADEQKFDDHSARTWFGVKDIYCAPP